MEDKNKTQKETYWSGRLNKKAKLLKEARASVVVKKTKIANIQFFKIEAKGRPDVYCETEEIAVILAREYRIEIAYQIAKKVRPTEIKTKL